MDIRLLEGAKEDLRNGWFFYERQTTGLVDRLKLMVSLEMLAYTSSEQNYPHPAMRGVYGERGDFIALVANIARTRQIDRRRYLSALLSARGAWVEYLNAVHCALLFMGHESRKGVAFQRIFVDGCAGP